MGTTMLGTTINLMSAALHLGVRARKALVVVVMTGTEDGDQQREEGITATRVAAGAIMESVVKGVMRIGLTGELLDYLAGRGINNVEFLFCFAFYVFLARFVFGAEMMGYYGGAYL